MNHKKYWESTRVKGAYRQGREDAIDEMIYFFENKAICVNAECIHLEEEYSCVRCIAEQLKEQK